MAEEDNSVFRKKTLERISSPEQLTDYLHVTNPGIWWTLAAVIILLAGLLVWSIVANLESSIEVRVRVEDNTASVVYNDDDVLQVGMVVTTDTDSFTISVISKDEYGRNVGIGSTNLPDGTYTGSVVVETIQPIQFLLSPKG